MADPKLVRTFWDTPSMSAAILLTVDQSKRITLREAEKLWGARGRLLTMHFVGHDKDDALTTEEPSARIMQTLRSDEPLILTRFGCKIVEALEELCDVATIVDEVKVSRG